MNLEIAFDSLKRFMWKDTLLVVSTPNAYCWMSILLNILNYDGCHDDHKMTFTYKLLKQLCEANKLEVINFYYCNWWKLGQNLKENLIYFVSLFNHYVFPQFSEWLLMLLKIS